MQYIKIQINKKGFIGEKGEKLCLGKIITIEAFDEKTPRSPFYQRRLKDSITDNCVSIVKKEIKEIKKEVIEEIKEEKILTKINNKKESK